MTLAALLAGVWMYIAGGGGWADDFPYRHLPQAGADFFDAAGPAINSLLELPRAWSAHFLLVNGRLANMLTFLVLMLPGALQALLHAGAFFLLVYSIMRLSFGSHWQRHWCAAAFLIGMIWIVLPWNDCMASGCYYINYVWSSALNLAFLSLIIRRESRPGAALFILAIAASLMHEGISLTIDIFLVLFALRKPSIRLISIVYICCSLLPLLSPALYQLAEQRYQLPLTGYVIRLLIGKKIYTFVLAAIISALTIYKKKFTMLMGGEWLMIIAGIGIALMVRMSGRVFFWPLLIALVVIIQSLRLQLKPWLKITLTCFFTLITTLWLLLLCAWQYEGSRQRDEIMNQLRHGHDIIYMNLTEASQIPWILMQTPAFPTSDITYRANMAAEAFGDANHVIALLPRAWAGKNLNELPPIKGSAAAHGNSDIFLVKKPAESFLITYGPGKAPSHNPLDNNKRQAGNTEEIKGECKQINDTLYAIRPWLRFPALRGMPAARIDTIPWDAN